jgi:hypothetical protein
MRAITIQADGGPGGNDQVMEDAILHIVTHIPVGGKGFKFDGDLHDGTIVNHRREGAWVVSFRPIGRDAAARRRRYHNPYSVVRAIIDRRHYDDDPAEPREVTAEILACDGYPAGPPTGCEPSD